MKPKPQYRINIEDITAEVARMKERNARNIGPTGYEDMLNWELLDAFRSEESAIQRHYLKREILTRMHEPGTN